MVVVLTCVIVCVFLCGNDFNKDDNPAATDVVLSFVSYLLACLISICIGFMICCVLQLFLPNSKEDESYTVSDVYFSDKLTTESFEDTNVVNFEANDSNGKNTKITASMSDIRVEYSDNTTETVITKYKAYSFKKWYRYIYDSPNECYYVVTFPKFKPVENPVEETTTDTTTTTTEITTTITTEETTTTESETTTITTTTQTTTTTTTATTATTTAQPVSPVNGLTRLGTFTGTYYSGRSVPCCGGSGRTLIDCTVGSNGVKGSVASRYVYRNYGYNRNGSRTKIYIEFASIPSMNGWYYVDDCNAENSIIDFYFYYNSNCPWSRAGVTSVKAYI